MAAAVRARAGGGEEASGAVPAHAALRRVGEALDLGLRSAAIDRPRAAFYGNFGVLVRALAYIMAHGGPGLRNATMDAVLNANYMRKLLEPYYDLALQGAQHARMRVQRRPPGALGVRTGDIAKRLIDYGFHPYTVSFPLIVHGAMMIEPTETEASASWICSPTR
jgi:glycine dehydrogenase subunit 2